MTARPLGTFADRLALARRMVARSLPQPPVHVADQLGAASREVRQIHDRLGAVLPIIEPDRHWRQRMDTVPSDDTRALLLAALLGCTTICLHLRRGGPRPAIARLAQRRVDCDRCVVTMYRPATPADGCDTCGTRGVIVFHPFAVHIGPTLLVGDACRACAGVLGIVQEATA